MNFFSVNNAKGGASVSAMEIEARKEEVALGGSLSMGLVKDLQAFLKLI